MSREHRARWLFVAGVALATVLLAGCGGAASQGASTAGKAVSSTGGQTAYGPNAPAATAGTGQSSTTGPQYLVKTLAVAMTFSDTRKVATDLQTWIATTDPRSTSAGITYEQQDNNTYQISMSFSVAANSYPQVLAYLAGYAQTHHGTLNSLHETVQDVSNDYVDTQSRLKNLRVEQERLLALLKQATNLNDILTVEQRLTDVEGQIEQIEAHLNALNGQTTFYTVTITLWPVSVTPAPAGPTSSWNPGQTIHDAFTAALGFGQGLVSVIIWLAFFAIYLIPVALIVLLVRRVARARATRTETPTSQLAGAVAPGQPAQPPTQPQ